MSNQKTIKTEKPNIIYHYTTADAFINILKERSLWASDIHYMGDTTELTQPLDLAEAAIEMTEIAANIRYPKTKQLHNEIAQSMKNSVLTSKRVNIFVASFCTKGDLLSQWRGYGIPGPVYAIGFDRKKLINKIRPYSFSLRKCKYYSSSDYKIDIHLHVEKYFLNKRNNSNSECSNFSDEFTQEKAVTMKYDYFEEEKEWRIISVKPLKSNDAKAGFRGGKSVIIPYYAVPINLDSIVEIIVGPCPHQNLAIESVWGLSFKYKLNNMPIPLTHQGTICSRSLNSADDRLSLGY